MKPNLLARCDLRHCQAEQGKECEQSEAPEEGPRLLPDDAERKRGEEAAQSAHGAYQSCHGSNRRWEVLCHQLEHGAIPQPDGGGHSQSANSEWEWPLPSGWGMAP